jgi:hypothetical protein
MVPRRGRRGRWWRYPGRKNVSLVFSIRRMLLESSAAAPSNETRIAQAPVAERPVALPPARRWSLQMWITIFALAFATAIIFSVASYMLHTKYSDRFNKSQLGQYPQRRSPFV